VGQPSLCEGDDNVNLPIKGGDPLKKFKNRAGGGGKVPLQDGRHQRKERLSKSSNQIKKKSLLGSFRKGAFTSSSDQEESQNRKKRRSAKETNEKGVSLLLGSFCVGVE